MNDSPSAPTSMEIPEHGVCVYIDEWVCPVKVDLIYDGRMVVELTGDIATRVARLVTVSDIASDLIRSMSERQADDGPGPSIMYRLMRLAAEDAWEDIEPEYRQAFAEMVSYLKYIVAELRTIQNPESEEGVDARIAAVETLARFISHRRSIGPILDDKTWVSWVLGVDEIDRALLLDEEDHAPVFFSWAEYTDAFPRVPAFAITFRVVEDEEYRNMSHVERSTLTYFDYAGRGVTDSDYDEESSVPYEMVQNSLVFPGNPRYPEKPTMRLSYCAEEVVLDVGTLDLRESDNMVRRGREAIMIFPLDTRHLRTQTPGIALQ